MATTEPTPPPAPSSRAINWHRVRVYSLSLLLMLTMWFCATLLTLRLHPERFVDKLLAQFSFPSSTGRVYWLNRRTLRIDDVKLGDFFYAHAVILTASPVGLLRHHVAKVQILGGQLFTKSLYAALETPGRGKAKGLDWTIGRLEISRGTLLLDNFVTDTSIPVDLGMRYPVVLNNLKLGRPDASREMTRERTVEISNVNIVSPFDPLAPVLAFPLTRVRFTYDELWHHRIREVDMIRPTIFLGQDLFWFSDKFKSENAASADAGPTAPWQVGHFEVQYGQLAVNAFGQPVAHFPFFFDTKVDDIRLDQLDKISAKSVIAIRRLNQDYPDYKIRLVGLGGKIYFSLPLTDAAANNVVNTISIDEISWNDIPVKEVSSTVTYDQNGVYGKLNGKCEGGELAGNFEFYYSKGFTWNANFFASKINCQPIAEKMAGKYFDLSGEINGNLTVQGRATEILNCQGTLTLPNPGLLEIKSLNGLLDRLPANTSALKRDALKIALASFQTYPYRSGELKIDYKPEAGVGTLKLDSPNGRRNFEIYLHPYESSKVAKAGDNQ